MTGCAAVMASRQPDKRNTSVLSPGTPRGFVVAELGTPVLSETRDGNKVDTFTFKQGYSTTTKVLRAMFHIAADVFTLFLWEIIGMPIEMVASGTDTNVQVTYDENDKVQSSFVLEK